MKLSSFFIVLLLAIPVSQACAQGNDGRNGEVKALSGMSIVGNDEAPKSLYIVPWKSSEVGVETGLGMVLVTEKSLVDREEFRRKLEYYKLTKSNTIGR